MRVTLDLDDHLMDSLMARHPGGSRAEAVEAVIVGHLRRGGVDRLPGSAGQVEVEDASTGLLAIDRRA